MRVSEYLSVTHYNCEYDKDQQVDVSLVHIQMSLMSNEFSLLKCLNVTEKCENA